MAEAVLRRHKRRTDRWLPKEKRSFDRELLKRFVKAGLRCVPGFLLSLADMMGIPSGFQAAYGMALAATGQDVRPVLTGSAAALLLRLLSGIDPRWELLLTMMMVAAVSLFLNGRGTWTLMLTTAVSMLPVAICASLNSTAAGMLQGWAAVLIAALSAPVMARAVSCITSQRQMSALEERVAVGYLAAVCLCGGARVMLPGLNLGVLLSACAVLAMALVLGVSVGALSGMLAGVMLALQGLPLTLSVALSMGGFLAGMANSLSRRRLSSGAFAMGSYLPLLLCNAEQWGMGASMLAASLVIGLLPRSLFEPLQQFLRRFLNNDPAPGDAYAAAALSAWEHTVAAMARAVPSPRGLSEVRDGCWWQDRLCQGCPEYAQCGCMTTDLAVGRAEAVWEYRHAQDEIWHDALENLRGLGCQRLYCLLEAMNALRQEDEASQRVISQAQAQRDMLVTHLTAMSGAARRFAALSSGENWWDDMAARRIRRELAERATPAALSYVRRVQGHVQAAFELQFITGARQQAEELCLLTAAVLDVPMQLASIDGDRILLMEKPILYVDVGVAAEPLTGGEICGDTAWSGILADGCCLVALSDGMGHGPEAALSSRQTVELLRLCLDAGYTRRQTLTAVNGMLLLGGGGERFATADVLVIDLWRGHATLDKLGAAASWLYQQGKLSRLLGDALPLGILEELELNGSSLRMSAGDAIILLTDGVEDAFCSNAALEAAIQASLECVSPMQAAEALLACAAEADGGQRRDDQSAVFVYIRSSRNE